jgi:hypothetical protein
MKLIFHRSHFKGQSLLRAILWKLAAYYFGYIRKCHFTIFGALGIYMCCEASSGHWECISRGLDGFGGDVTIYLKDVWMGVIVLFRLSFFIKHLYLILYCKLNDSEKGCDCH